MVADTAARPTAQAMAGQCVRTHEPVGNGLDTGAGKLQIGAGEHLLP